MKNPKYRELIKRLLEQTKRDVITWKITSEKNTFNALFTGFTVQISSSWEYSDEIGEPLEIYHVRIFNADGDEIAVIEPIDFEKGDFDERYPYYTFEDLFGWARSKAMGVDMAVDSLLKQLREKDEENTLKFPTNEP
jgi:hypothetical protein